VPRVDAIIVEGTVVEVLSSGVFQVELENGHRVVAHAARQDRARVAEMAVGRRVRLEMSAFDMSNGRILVERTNEMKVQA
jgi:translation initiation factor IF-1